LLKWRGRQLVAIAAVVAVIFGLATLAAGTSVLLGSDPGYAVFRPLLVFNTTMGAVYIVVGLLAWRHSRLGLYGAASIALLNLLALCAIAYLYAPEGPVASTSLQAMAFRTAVWVALLGVFAWASNAKPGTRNDA
jgi:hypothetical protein